MASKYKILPALVDFIEQHRDWPAVVLTPRQHDQLKLEMGSTGPGTISMFEGAKIVIGSQSDLPPVPKPDLKTAPTLQALIEAHGGKLVGELKLEPPDPTFTNVITGPGKPYMPGQSFSMHQAVTTVLEKTPAHTTLQELKDDAEEMWQALKAGPKPVKVYHQSTSDEHSTPQALFDRLDDEFHFDLDVCATAPHEIEADGGSVNWIPGTPMLDPGNAKCPVYFTKEDDGLSHQWFGRVWMNPPYTHGQVGVWIQKLLKELVVGRITLGVALTAARPDTAWFQVVASYANEIRFLKGRLTFEGQKNAAPFPSVVLVFDPKATTQIVKFWDWQTGKAPVYWKTPGYTFIPGKAGTSGMALPSLKGLSKLALVK